LDSDNEDDEQDLALFKNDAFDMHGEEDAKAEFRVSLKETFEKFKDRDLEPREMRILYGVGDSNLQNFENLLERTALDTKLDKMSAHLRNKLLVS